MQLCFVPKIPPFCSSSSNRKNPRALPTLVQHDKVADVSRYLIDYVGFHDHHWFLPMRFLSAIAPGRRFASGNGRNPHPNNFGVPKAICGCFQVGWSGYSSSGGQRATGRWVGRFEGRGPQKRRRLRDWKTWKDNQGVCEPRS